MHARIHLDRNICTWTRAPTNALIDTRTHTHTLFLIKHKVFHIHTHTLSLSLSLSLSLLLIKENVFPIVSKVGAVVDEPGQSAIGRVDAQDGVGVYHPHPSIPTLFKLLKDLLFLLPRHQYRHTLGPGGNT